MTNISLRSDESNENPNKVAGQTTVPQPDVACLFGKSRKSLGAKAWRDRFERFARENYTPDPRQIEWSAGVGGPAEIRAAWDRRQEKWFVLYDEYLRSAEWKEKRQLILLRDGGRCTACPSQAEHVHHISYRCVGNEQIKHLTSLCKPCHKKFHGRDL